MKKMYFLLGEKDGKRAVVLYSTNKKLLADLGEAMERKREDIKYEVIPGIDYSQFNARRKE
jgi:precorrin-4 methylase